MNVLVTGGAGFIGSHLTDALVSDHDVTVLDDFSSGSRGNVHPSATVVEGDIRDERRLDRAARDADVIFHEAASVSVDRSIEDPEGSHGINVEATLATLEAARREDARCVLASSAAIYGHPERIPIDESAPKSPASPYGIEKLSVDHYARVYEDLYGLPTIALRYFNAYGPRQTASDYSGVISVFLEQARAGRPITVHGDGSQTRDFVHVDDVVRANLLAMETDRLARPTTSVPDGRSRSRTSRGPSARRPVRTPRSSTPSHERGTSSGAGPTSRRPARCWATNPRPRLRTDWRRSSTGPRRCPRRESTWMVAREPQVRHGRTEIRTAAASIGPARQIDR